MIARFARTLAASGALLAASGCVSSIKADDPTALAHADAVVLLGVKSAIPLTEARMCTAMCYAWYSLDAHHDDVYAYPVRVGSEFDINTVLTADNRVGPLKGGPLKIEKPGAYYYGTIRSNEYKVMMDRRPDPEVLVGAWRKFGAALSAMNTQNFSWPAAGSAPEAFHYRPSNKTQALLKDLVPVNVVVDSIAPPPSVDSRCRLVPELPLPDQLHHEEYLRRAMNAEFKAAGWQDANPTVHWTGQMGPIYVKTTEPAAWDMSVSLSGPNGAHLDAKVHSSYFSPGYSAACMDAENAQVPAIKDLIEAIVSDPGFAAFAGTRAVAPPAEAPAETPAPATPPVPQPQS